MRVLVVDDDVIILKGLGSILRKMELDALHVLTAENALDAAEILKYQRIDLLITDVDMPAMTGLELIGEVRRRNYPTCCIVLSGFDKFEFAQQAIRYQALDYLLKPINKTDLMHIVRAIYDEIEGVSQAIPKEVADLPIYEVTAEPADLPENLREILTHMKTYYNSNISLEALSEHFGIHANYICFLFQKHMSTTYLTYLDCLRLQHSVELMTSKPKMPIDQISSASGFVSDRHFYKVFKKRIGITPGALREMLRQPRSS